MKRLVIGMDIDGVIVDFGRAVLPLLSEVCKRRVEYHDLCSWDLAEALDVDQETMSDTWKRILCSDLLKYAPPVAGAIEGLCAVSRHEIWLVTSRPLAIRNLTLRWLDDNLVRYDHIVFNRRGDKLSVGPVFDVFVEDFLEEACRTAEAGIFTILFDQPWNSASALPDNCRRVSDWSVVLDLINDLAEN